MTEEEIKDLDFQIRLKRKYGRNRFYKAQKMGFLATKDIEKYLKQTVPPQQQKANKKDHVRHQTISYMKKYFKGEKVCQLCGKNAEIHHPDYTNYLKINLLCSKHHRLLHNFMLVPPPVIDLLEEANK